MELARGRRGPAGDCLVVARLAPLVARGRQRLRHRRCPRGDPRPRAARQRRRAERGRHARGVGRPRRARRHPSRAVRHVGDPREVGTLNSRRVMTWSATRSPACRRCRAASR